jgi:hypothetical protein
VVPDGERHHGSPAQPTEIDYVRVGPARCNTSRRFRFGLATVIQLFLLYAPLTVGGIYMLFQAIPALGRRADAGTADITSSNFLIDALLLSTVLFFGFAVVGLAFVYTVPRLLSLAVKPDKVYPLYGFHYAAHRAIAGMTNLKFFTWFFGDSSYIVHYLRGLGYAFRGQRNDGGGRPIPRGPGPVMVPLDSEILEGVGLLGPPCFEIPRSVERDSRFDHVRTGDELRRRLAAKNRYNLRSMVFFLLVRWLHTFVLTAFGLASIGLHGALGHIVIAAYLALTLGFTAFYFVLVERCVASFRALRPRLCSIYDPYFWWHERLWKVPDEHLELGRLHPQRREQNPVPLAGGRHLQVRPHHARCRLHPRCRHPCALRRDRG